MNSIESSEKEVRYLQNLLKRKKTRNRYRSKINMNLLRKLSVVDAQRTFKLMMKDNLLFSFATDQSGSRFLQEHLGSISPHQLGSTFALLKPDFITICEDVFGN